MHPLRSMTLTYLAEIQKQRAQTHSTEELSYRDFLGKFLRAVAPALGKPAEFTGEARKITWGRPDYTVTDGLRVIGYIEAEALGTPLTQLKGHAEAQNARFRENLHNFLLTNHTEFRLYRDGKEVAAAQLPEPPVTGKGAVGDAALDALQSLFENFLDAATPAAVSAEDLARQLAKRAGFLRVAADAMLSHDDSPLHPFWNLYRETLFADIGKEKFADVYAQTFAYGLFLAWLNTDRSPFDRDTALRALPRAVPPIRVLLTFAGGDELPEAFRWIVDGLCADLDAANKATATQHTAGIQDPLIHFYEPFLAAYDPQLRERAGVYYTPDPVVDFLVRAVDDLLKRDFGKESGLADPSVRLLDPATGTATFLARAYRQVHQTMAEAGDAGLWPDRARDHVARHFYGFERLPAAYTLAHVKLRQQLGEMGVPLGESDRLPIFLADTMMNRVPAQLSLPGANILSQEIRDAAKVRDQEEILVILGNPPYFGKSDNPSKDSLGHPTFIGELMQDYYQVDGVPLGEKNPKWLQNDYVKFLRFAQWRVERSGQGIVAFITDNSYLDNPTFRGMRRSLMKTFDEIDILDLHGNSNKRERSPDGSKDENVFDIKQGVAICLLIKRPVSKNKGKQVVRHADFYGLRSQKYARPHLRRAARISDTNWANLTPNPPYYLFMPQEQAHREEYEAGWKVTEIFPVNVLGFQTHRDQLAIDFDEAGLKARVASFARAEQHENELRRELGLGTWDIANAQSRLRASDAWEGTVTRCLYRPFDVRAWCSSNLVTDRPRAEIVKNMVGKQNLSLNITRQTRAEGWRHAVVSNLPTPAVFVEVKDGSYVFPLWLYPTDQEKAFGMGRRANIAPDFLAALTARVGETPTPEEVFHYAYAVFHAPTYRSRYAAFLKSDFPRLPLPPDADTFQSLAALGAKLTVLHLLEAPELKQHGIGFPVGGTHVVQKMRREDRYVAPRQEEPHPASPQSRGGAGEETTRAGTPPSPCSDGEVARNEPEGVPSAPATPGRVRLNGTEYFDAVPPEAWNFQVGGYQPAFKWLDDRKGRALTEEDITHYRRMLAALRDTAALLPQVDAAFLRLLAANTAIAPEEAGEAAP